MGAMQPYEFLAAVQRLTLIGQMVLDTDVEGVLDYLNFTEAISPIFDASPQLDAQERVAVMRRFTAAALDFKRVASDCRPRLVETGAMAGQSRRMLVGAAPGTPPSEG